MDTEMTCYESFAEVTEDFYCSAVDVLKILVLRLNDYHARCFHSLRDALYDYFSTDAAPHTHANVSTKHTAENGSNEHGSRADGEPESSKHQRRNSKSPP